MGKINQLRNAVNSILFNQKDLAMQAEGWAHLYGVSQVAALLAGGRGLDAGTCAAAGLLHDIYTFRTGEEKDHALHGAAEAAAILNDIPGYAAEERNEITGMILRHSDKVAIDGPMEECLKDADVFAHWLFEREKKFNRAKRERLAKVMKELGIRGNIREE